MAGVGIVTDTVACLEPAKVKQYGIRIVPVFININGKEYRDQVDLSTADFWKMFPEIKEFGASAPSMAEYTRVFEELSQTTDSIACTFVSKGLSGTYEAAVQARDIFQKTHPNIRIEIIDSRHAVGAEGFIVLEMARAAEAGKSLDEVIAVANEMIPRVRLVCALDTLKLVIKIGRAPKSAYLGELFQVKPLIGFVNNTGVVENLGRARGMEKAMLKLVEMMEQYIDPNKPTHINVHYSNSVDDGEKLKKLVTSRFNPAEFYFTPFSPVICGAVGPFVAVAFYS